MIEAKFRIHPKIRFLRGFLADVALVLVLGLTPLLSTQSLAQSKSTPKPERWSILAQGGFQLETTDHMSSRWEYSLFESPIVNVGGRYLMNPGSTTRFFFFARAHLTFVQRYWELTGGSNSSSILERKFTLDLFADLGYAFVKDFMAYMSVGGNPRAISHTRKLSSLGYDTDLLKKSQNAEILIQASVEYKVVDSFGVSLIADIRPSPLISFGDPIWRSILIGISYDL